MRQRDRQRVSRVWVWKFFQVQEALDHFGDRQLLRASIPDDGLLYASRRELEDVQTCFRHCRQRRAPRFTHDQSGLKVLGEE